MLTGLKWLINAVYDVEPIPSFALFDRQYQYIVAVFQAKRKEDRGSKPNIDVNVDIDSQRLCGDHQSLPTRKKLSSNNVYSGYGALNDECLKQGQIQGYKEKLWLHRIEFILLNWISNLPSSLFHCLWLSFKIRLAPRFPCDNRPFAFAGSLRKR